MNEETSAPVQHCIGQVRSLCYLLDEPTTTLTIQAGGQTITARASGQIAQDLHVLPRGATICVTLPAAPLHDPQIIAFTVLTAEGWNGSKDQCGDV